MKNGKPYSRTQFDTITWKIVNRGDEATKAKQLELSSKDDNNKTVFEADTAYLGHHYVECLIKRTYNSQNVRIRFGVYVR